MIDMESLFVFSVGAVLAIMLFVYLADWLATAIQFRLKNERVKPNATRGRIYDQRRSFRHGGDNVQRSKGVLKPAISMRVIRADGTTEQRKVKSWRLFTLRRAKS